MQSGCIKNLVVTILVTSLAPPMLAQDSADLAKEAKIHRNYEKYYSQPTSEEKWQQALAGSAGQNYVIQKGDTLWDVSETFFGDPEFWPKLWALNKQRILNPHQINPEYQIAFIPGNLGEPPKFELTEKNQEQQQPGDADASNDQTLPAAPKPFVEEDSLRSRLIKPEMKHEYVDVDLSTLPIPESHKKKWTNPFPNSVPSWSFREADKVNLDLDLKKVERSRGPSQVLALSYVQEDKLAEVGKIEEAEADMEIAHENQYVAVSIKGGTSPGQKLLAIREVGDILGRGGSGSIIQIDGEVQILGPVGEGGKLLRAIITRAYAPIAVGTVLVEGKVERYDAGPGTPEAEVSANVVGGAFTDARHIFGNGEIIFLDSGSSGLSVGKVLKVFRIEKNRAESTRQVSNPRPIGIIRVGHVGKNFSSAVVLNETEEIQIGDSTMGSALMAEAPSSPPEPSVGDSSTPAPEGENNGDSGGLDL